jgi:hypothetical protein
MLSFLILVLFTFHIQGVLKFKCKSPVPKVKVLNFKCVGGYVLKTCKGKAIPLQAWIAPKGSRRLRFPDFKTIHT